MKRLVRKLILLVTEFGAPLTLLSSLWLKLVRKAGTGRIGDLIFMKTGVLPVPDHYYQPLINPRKHLKKSLRGERDLPGIDFNAEEQVKLLNNFNYNEELLMFPADRKAGTGFYYNNESYGTGDAEFLYNMVRWFRPGRIIEIGGGYSTLLIEKAIRRSKLEDDAYCCHHTCIEPYEQTWLEKTGAEVIRKKVEDLDKAFFQTLETNDILFIDSSHVIRPQGDVLFEYLELLPSLNQGVVIHIHDIFSPRDYPDDWVYNQHLFWNEQYLLEAFLTCNKQFKIVGALNYLAHNHRRELAAKCPVFADRPESEPGAFWITKI